MNFILKVVLDEGKNCLIERYFVYSSGPLWIQEIFLHLSGDCKSFSPLSFGGGTRNFLDLLDFSVEEVHLDEGWFSASYANLSPFVGLCLESPWGVTTCAFSCALLGFGGMTKERNDLASPLTSLVIWRANCFDFIFAIYKIWTDNTSGVVVGVCVWSTWHSVVVSTFTTLVTPPAPNLLAAYFRNVGI